jgi:hypothetical protein
MTGLAALLSLSIAYEAAAQEATCPCNFEVSARQLSRGFFFCNSAQFGGEAWAGARIVDVFKGAKGGREPGANDMVLSLKDFNPNSGDPEIGDNFCEIASGLRKNSGTFRNVLRIAVDSIEEWHACLVDLSDLGMLAMDLGRDFTGVSCADTVGSPIEDGIGIGLADRLEYVGFGGASERLLEEPPLPSSAP